MGLEKQGDVHIAGSTVKSNQIKDKPLNDLLSETVTSHTSKKGQGHVTQKASQKYTWEQ